MTGITRLTAAIIHTRGAAIQCFATKKDPANPRYGGIIVLCEPSDPTSFRVLLSTDQVFPSPGVAEELMERQVATIRALPLEEIWQAVAEVEEAAAARQEPAEEPP